MAPFKLFCFEALSSMVLTWFRQVKTTYYTWLTETPMLRQFCLPDIQNYLARIEYCMAAKTSSRCLGLLADLSAVDSSEC